MHLIELKKKTPAELVAMAEELGVEQASTLRKQDLLFGILKALADSGEEIIGSGTIEVLSDGFGFCRSADANYLAGPDDIYLQPGMVRRYGIRTGDTIEGEIRAPKDGERYFSMTKLTRINFDDPETLRHRVNFDNLTPLYPNEKLNLDNSDP
ncbi:MAG: Rho termination factor N-terminal domain-containing protein, partial [Sandaracinobacteroides sp.]